MPVREEKKTAPLIMPVREEKKTAPLIMPVREEKSEILEDWKVKLLYLQTGKLTSQQMIWAGWKFLTQ